MGKQTRIVRKKDNVVLSIFKRKSIQTFLALLFFLILWELIVVPIAFSPFMQRTIYPLLVFSQLVPKVALAPIFVIWFGFRLLPKLMVVFLLSYFPVVLNSIVGMRTIDPEIINLSRSTGATPMRMFFKVRLPQRPPDFFYWI